MAKAKEICKKYNVLLIADEVQVRAYIERDGLESERDAAALVVCIPVSDEEAERKGG